MSDCQIAKFGNSAAQSLLGGVGAFLMLPNEGRGATFHIALLLNLVDAP